MARRGWNGTPPADDGEAAARIVAAAAELIGTRGTTSIAEVAEALGVIRQTVYRYFPTVDALLQAAAVQAVGGFLDRLAAHLDGITDPADAVVEGIVFTLDQVPRTPHLRLMLSGAHSHTEAIASDQAMAFGMTMIRRFDVDWPAHGYDEPALRELVEFQLRIMQSFFISPSIPSRSPSDLRNYLTRWIAPAVTDSGGRTRPE
ncbi:Transcriptional regulator, TetR family OS=Tsukamurella paurometabola (strain ATCC 8368 / DSM/ CCUG 35730 / CIP 100753 / JCM 10117 / KCTC 9821 / NBRC 16120/ NCIMB 702349 / NCTC 13040) OX=521096 GN=Tpau_2465 PE=4 SV=1 [Tsukamurella paurometabola]|uniref:Transcriptional regulator, TetR family n=1 Tax=Tsukamurella paurometabola (strain ATCC 8368 / DSM 20162 / CCUG 35730 / CIP 100753 / JCM 10117 / KCTC 9821 / NBRC 16120 / NCIMB 702349 / NCTC 13040) TaxID=521096 RepID=D5UR81_TSUPD|nr:TetR family transcriptional regulator [Tsukamurella paurometabola]ADG79070.1 transcriptional regulator, TetR family [Tsukamurella paurometabola DSM 20162]SUP33970.1 Bacterial regulatory proteins, tetR family [Tsukamurella paurometabola]